ncbi:MAG TPA: acyl-CoA dehydrogenase family protein [Ilumatobacter sp.]|nr:acyl-CoA dehydrogenase family protein [Ilumatobacter sp.]
MNDRTGDDMQGTDTLTREATEATIESVRVAVRAWLMEHWQPDAGLVSWRRQLASSGWAVPSWPEQWHGRGLPAWADDVVRDEFARGGFVGPPAGVGMRLAGPAILTHGPDHLRQEFLHGTITGETTWCQLFSEPGAGSDLAGLTATATLDGDAWVINGQKVWSTSAHHADLGLLLARTDWNAPKHLGISCFILPMRQPGVEVRPLRQMNGHSSFNEIFLTDARVPIGHVIGGKGKGWDVALTTLAFERRFGVMSRPMYTTGEGRAVEEARREAAEHHRPYVWYPQRAGRVDLVLDRARATARSDEPVLRQEIARLMTISRISQWTAQRAQSARALGRPPGPEGSIGKLATSLVSKQAAHVHAAIAGAGGMLTGRDSPLDGVIAEILVSVPAQSIAGGTDEIQRNILAERVLGLPREGPSTSDRPFREVMHGS